MKTSFSFFIIALVLAGTASGLNYAWYKSNKPNTVRLTVYCNDIAKGTSIGSQDLCEVEVLSSATDENIRSFYLPYESIDVVTGTKAASGHHKGEFVLRQDVRLSEPLSRYSILGPFRLISVGNRIVSDEEDRETAYRSGNESAVTVAVKVVADPDNTDISQLTDNASRLLQILENSSNSSILRITGVVAYAPKTDSPKNSASASPSMLEKDEVALFVPLPNVETIPDVLMSGTVPEIGFVVPAMALLSKNSDSTEKHTVPSEK